MSTLTVPPVLTSPRDDATQLYKAMHGEELSKRLKSELSGNLEVIKSETSGSCEYALLTILQSAENPGKYFAKVLHKAMDGLETDDTTLIRVIITRAEIDMQYIKGEYYEKYGKSLKEAVRSEASGDYKNFLVVLLGPSP